MYQQYFQLKQAPFSIAPDPRYLFMSERHREALAHLLYGIGSGGGFVLLTGEIGAGKTTVCRCFMEQVPAHCKLAYIFNPRLTVEELLLTVCDEFDITLAAGDTQPGVKAYVDAINAYLLASHARGMNNVLVIDEAQNLSAPVLEQLRLLTNLETSERKLLQIILIGQPELRGMLARPELEQLAQRVIARYHLGPLSQAETGAYIAHRLAVAGALGTPFPPRVIPLIQRLTHGVPRRINLLCDRALLGAYVEHRSQVTPAIVKKAAAEVFADAAAPARARWLVPALAGAAGAVLVAAGWYWWPGQALDKGAPEVAAQPATAEVAPAAVQGAALAAPVAAAAGAAAADVATAGAAAPSGDASAWPQMSSTEALAELAQLWGPDFVLPAGRDLKGSCDALAGMNLRCYQGRGGMYELRLLDRPAAVLLHDGAQQYHAILVAATARSVTLMAGGVRQQVDLADFVPRFGGEFTTLWRMPRAFRDMLGAGDRGPDADWLAQRLAEWQQRNAPPLDQPIDARTSAWLKQFQAQQQLKADGVAGPRTFMRLNQLSGVSEPRLLAPENES